MYKDKDKQREADRARQQRRRDVIKSKGVTNQGVTQGVTIIPKALTAEEIALLYKPKRGKDIKGGDHISGPVVIGKPGDADYNGVCTEAWMKERGRGAG